MSLNIEQNYKIIRKTILSPHGATFLAAHCTASFLVVCMEITK